MPRLYDGRMHANRLGAPCVGCGAAASRKWVGRGPYACTSRACQRALAAAARDDGESGGGALDGLSHLGDALPAVEDAGEAVGAAAAAAGSPPSVDAPVVLIDAGAQTDDVVDDDDVVEQLHVTIADLHAIVAEKDERIEELREIDRQRADRMIADLEMAQAVVQEKEMQIATLRKQLADSEAARHRAENAGLYVCHGLKKPRSAADIRAALGVINR